MYNNCLSKTGRNKTQFNVLSLASGDEFLLSTACLKNAPKPMPGTLCLRLMEKTGTFFKESKKLLSKFDEAEVFTCISSNLVFKESTDLSRHFGNHHLIYKYVINPLVNENYRKSQVSVTKITAYVNKAIKSVYMNKTIKSV